MELSLSAAAKLTGKSKSTLTRAIRAGHLSARRTDHGTYLINAAELARAFPVAHHDAAQRRTMQPVPDAADPLATEVAVLRERVASLTALLDREREAAAELRQANADLRRLLPDQAPALAAAPTPPPRSLLARLLGR